MRTKLHFNCDYNTAIIDELAKERTSCVGYYDLPYQNTAYVDNYMAQLDLNNIVDIIVVGIGGSSLGIKAIYNFIRASRKVARNIHVMDTTDPLAMTNLINKINLKKSHCIVISKSGITTETITIYKYLLNLLNDNQFSFITDKNSKLDKYARANNKIVVNIADNVGGRFSVLSAVGLIPLALCGINYQKLLRGAQEISDDFWQKNNADIIKKAYFYVNNYDSYVINAIFSYSNSLKYFNKWFEQLWAESLGKQQLHSQLHVGPTPITLIGPQDQHSFVQLLVEGNNNKTLTFITVEDFANNITVPDIKIKHLQQSDIYNKISFTQLINYQAQSTVQSLMALNKIPIDEIVLSEHSEYEIGKLIFYYQLLTSLVGKLLAVNTYNQKGVERGKIVLHQLLQNL